MTLEETIKALQEYFKTEEITYDPEHRVFYRTKLKTTRAIVSVNAEGNLIQHYYALPPKLFIALGQFYEGELKR